MNGSWLWTPVTPSFPLSFFFFLFLPLTLGRGIWRCKSMSVVISLQASGEHRVATCRLIVMHLLPERSHWSRREQETSVSRNARSTEKLRSGNLQVQWRNYRQTEAEFFFVQNRRTSRSRSRSSLTDETILHTPFSACLWTANQHQVRVPPQLSSGGYILNFYI